MSSAASLLTLLDSILSSMYREAVVFTSNDADTKSAERCVMKDAVLMRPKLGGSSSRAVSEFDLVVPRLRVECYRYGAASRADRMLKRW